MQLLCYAGLSTFWKELATLTTSVGTAGVNKVMKLPTLPPAFFPQLQNLYVRSSYEELTARATDGKLHLNDEYILPQDDYFILAISR